MSAVWLKLLTTLCLSCAALSDPKSSGVLWRDFGGAVTIQCRPPDADQEYLTLKKGLSEDFHIFHTESNSAKKIIATEFMHRLQLNGVFPNLDILIKNLTSNDTGPYWCVYKTFNPKTHKLDTNKGKGSVLVVVMDEPRQYVAQQCETSNVLPSNMVLVTVGISAAVLFVIIMILLIWIILKTKTRRTTVKPRRVATNDVYEDMRGTLRR